VGLLSVFSTPNYHYSMSAIEDSALCHVQLEPVKDVLKRNGDFGITLLSRISKAADFIINHTLELSRLHLRGRIAYILLDFSGNIYNSPSFDLPVSRREIGELIGMTTENVIRILSEFRKDGLIEISNKTITLKNREMLERISRSG
jgi:CRP/FNR family transcriptional regulator